MSSLKLIQIGTGNWGMSWVDVVKRSPHWELSAIVDINDALFDQISAMHDLPKNMFYTDLNKALARAEADAALVVVPPELHEKVSVQAMKSGLDVIIEKPIADSIESAKEIVRVANSLNRKLMVSQNYRFKKAPQTVKSVIARDLIGKIGTVYINFMKDPPFDGFRCEMQEPLIVDMAVHHFDQIRGILSLDPVRVTAHSWNPPWSRFKGNACTNVVFEMEDGQIVVYTGSWVSQGWETTWDGEWHIQGDDGEIIWKDNSVTILPKNIFKTVFMEGAIEREGRLAVNLKELPEEERLACLAEFSSAIFEDRDPETSGSDNLKSLAMVLCAKRSAEEGRPILIDEILSD